MYPIIMCEICFEDKPSNEIVTIHTIGVPGGDSTKGIVVACAKCYTTYIQTRLNNIVRYAQEDATQEKAKNKERT